MRTLRDVVFLGLVIRAGLWFFDHEVAVLTGAAIAVGAALAAWLLLFWFIPGFARGWRREFGRPEADERRELMQRLDSDMRTVQGRWVAADEAERYSPR